MRKTIIFPVFLILLLLTSCVPDTPYPPIGVWVSEDPRIVLFLKPEYQIPVGPLSFLGLYTIDGVETKVFAAFGNGLRFAIYDLTEPRGTGRTGGGINHSGLMLSGTYRVVGNEIHYTLHQEHIERLGINRIIFHRVEDYEPIDPYYWLPDFFPRSESE